MKCRDIWRLGFFVWLGISVLCVIVALLLPEGTPWGPIDGNHSDMCELRDEKALIRQPLNTWSNLAYVLVGILILFRERSVLGTSLGGALVFLGVGSAAFHASLTQTMQYLDIMGIGVVLLSFFFLFAVTFFGSRSGAFSTFVRESTAFHVVLACVAWLAGLVLGAFKPSRGPFDSDWVVAMSVAITLPFIVALMLTKKPPFLHWLPGLIALPIFVVAALFKFLDGPNGVLAVSPESAFQPHSLWHAFSAAAFLLIYEFASAFRGPETSLYRDAAAGSAT